MSSSENIPAVAETKSQDRAAMSFEQLSPECSKQILEVASQMGRILVDNPNGVTENPRESSREIAEGSSAGLPAMLSCVLKDLRASRSSR